MSGNRSNTPENSQSIIEATLLQAIRLAATTVGASGDVVTVLVPEPMCMHSTVLVSSHARKNGSQCRVWMLGRPSHAGSSENATARTPRAALRRISAAASSGSHSGTTHSGISRPPLPPAHSSTMKSL